MMLHRQSFLLLILLCITGSVLAQKGKKAIRLNSGVIYASPNILSDSIENINRRALRQEKGFVIIQFETTPTEEVKR